MQVVISSAFETSLGLAQYAHLAAAIGCFPRQEAVRHGLGTSAWFERDIADNPLVTSEPGVLLYEGSEMDILLDLLQASRLFE